MIIEVFYSYIYELNFFRSLNSQIIGFAIIDSYHFWILIFGFLWSYPYKSSSLKLNVSYNLRIWT